MLKKSTLALSAIGAINLAAAQSQLSSCDLAGNCTGFFYEDINAAFVDCFDMNGVLLSRKENFFTSALQKECATTDYASLQVSLNGTVPMVSVAANQTVDLCNYFEVGAGYQFSQADNGIGLVLLEDLVGSARDLYWKNMVSAPVNLGWNWGELVQLIQALEGSQCAGVNATLPSLPNVSGSLSDLLAALNLPWSQWTATALQNLNVASWTKAEWKFWLQTYVSYWNALQAYGSSISGAVSGDISGAVSSIESIAASLVSGAAGEISANAGELESLLSQGASLVLDNVNLTGAVNFTQIWSPNFDLESVTIGEILNDLSVASNIVGQVESWFSAFFVNGGLTNLLNVNETISIEGGNQTTNITIGSGSAPVVVDVSAGVEAVIAWITANFQSEVQSLFPQYNFTFTTGSTWVPPVVVGGGNSTVNGTGSNGTIGGDNSTNGTIGGDNSTNSSNGTIGGNNSTLNGTDSNSTLNGTGSGSAPGLNTTANMSSSSYTFTFENYAVPSGCAYVAGSNDSIRCSSGNSRGVTFTFAEINEFWDFSAQQSCSDAQSTLVSCQSNTVITDLDTCLRLSYYNTFQLASDTFIYGWLSFDLVAQNALFGRCQVESNGFSVSASEYSAAFTFAFPNIN